MKSQIFVLAVAVMSCTSNDKGPQTTVVDAPMVAIDAPHTPPIDAPAAVTALGKKCGGPADCPSNAPVCTFIGTNTQMYCSPTCLIGGTGMTNASGAFTSIAPTPDTTQCNAAFTGAAGAPVCGVLISYSPMDNPFKANTTYNDIIMACAIICTSGACPTGMTCNAAIGPNGVCFPN